MILQDEAMHIWQSQAVLLKQKSGTHDLGQSVDHWVTDRHLAFVVPHFHHSPSSLSSPSAGLFYFRTLLSIFHSYTPIVPLLARDRLARTMPSPVLVLWGLACRSVLNRTFVFVLFFSWMIRPGSGSGIYTRNQSKSRLCHFFHNHCWGIVYITQITWFTTMITFAGYFGQTHGVLS